MHRRRPPVQSAWERGFREEVRVSTPCKDKGGDISRLGNLGLSWNPGRGWDKDEKGTRRGVALPRRPGCYRPRGVCAPGTCARARGTPQQTKPGPRRRRRRHFVSSAQWGRVTAERGSETGEGGISQALGRENRA